MSDCGCTGHYHNGGCADQNPVFWKDGREPVSPTQQEIKEQRAANLARMTPEQRQRILDDASSFGSCSEDRARFLARQVR